ncbi:hypothetical protein [Wolbachia endosymbiont of Oedothorax gibbosus]|uniref:hypothetical protein n=1 Tax=Wolbachia endosymbiont of Oedothorax gibbosus TaxID=931100 RepID=UPI002023C292|nr:hypothetical protein [Wolbachia endosymbiont of Oedothorax gibbosus]
MSRIFSKYKEKFAPNAQIDLMNIIESDEQMFQDYKKFLNRKKIDGICRHLCDYITLNDLLVNKESFIKAFDSIEKKRSLVNDLIKKVKNDDINSDEVNKQKFEQELYNSFDKDDEVMKEVRKITNTLFKRMSKKAQENFMEEMEQILHSREIAKSPFLGMKKPKTLTVADLNLAAMNQNQYMKISYNPVISGDSGHAVLIKKNSDNSFAFYDPNFGAVFDLTEKQLCEVVTQSFYGYVRISKLGIVALFTLLTSVVAGIAAAVYGYNIIASVLLVTCLVDLSILCCLKEKLMPQKYDTITPENNISIINNDFQVELKNLVDKYSSDNCKLGSTAESDVQVESVTKGNLILGNVSNL